MRITLALINLAAAQQESSEYFTGTRRLKQGDIITACDAENAELAVITEGVESNVDDVRKLLQGGKYMINGIDELTGKCMFLSKNGEITKKKCTPGRNKYICQYKVARILPEPTTTQAPTEPPTTADPCTPSNNPSSLDPEHYFISSPGNAMDGITWHEAREQCQELGDSWDLAIFNNRNEYESVYQVLVDNCAKHSYWVGYKEANGEPVTIFKKSVPWGLQWGATEPNDNQGREDCVRMDKFGEFNDAICKKTWTGAERDNLAMGMICEKHAHVDKCIAKPSEELPEDARYFIGEAGEFDWESSRSNCIAKGAGWDLAVVDDIKEHQKLVAMTNCVENAFWLGMKETNNNLVDLNGNRVLFTPWDTHSNPSNPEPNDHTGDEECVRMRGNVINDAKCELKTTGSSRNGVGMGYICEYDATKVISDVTDLLPCGANKNVNPFVSGDGCPTPISCETGARLKIIDGWKVGGGNNGPVKYGFVGQIVLPASLQTGDWSILIRFSSQNTRGNYQLWNGKFFNFYQNGNEVLLHNKWWSTDRMDQDSFAFVADGLNSAEYPEILSFTGRKMNHVCFDRSMHAGVRGGNSGGEFQKSVFEEAISSDNGQRSSGKNSNEILEDALEQTTKVRYNRKKNKVTSYKVNLPKGGKKI